jgi:hypothetical protein
MCDKQSLQQVTRWIVEDVERLITDGIDIDTTLIQDVMCLEKLATKGYFGGYPSLDFDIPEIRSL